MNDLTLVNLNATILQTGTNTVYPPDPTLQTAEPFIANGPEACSTAIPSGMATLYSQMYTQAAYQYRI